MSLRTWIFIVRYIILFQFVYMFSVKISHASLFYLTYIFTVPSVWKTSCTEYERKVKWPLLKPSLCTCFSGTDEVRAVHVLRPGQVWQLWLLLDYATLTTQQPGKVRPYRVSERWDDDVSLWCLRFSPLDFVVFLLCVSVNFSPICWGRVSHQSWTVKLLTHCVPGTRQ